MFSHSHSASQLRSVKVSPLPKNLFVSTLFKIMMPRISKMVARSSHATLVSPVLQPTPHTSMGSTSSSPGCNLCTMPQPHLSDRTSCVCEILLSSETIDVDIFSSETIASKFYLWHDVGHAGHPVKIVARDLRQVLTDAILVVQVLARSL